MSQKKIKLRISPDGQVQAEILGFQGKKCTDYISVLEQMLDAEATDSDWTAEYFLEESVKAEETVSAHFIEVARSS